MTAQTIRSTARRVELGPSRVLHCPFGRADIGTRLCHADDPPSARSACGRVASRTTIAVGAEGRSSRTACRAPPVGRDRGGDRVPGRAVLDAQGLRAEHLRALPLVRHLRLRLRPARARGRGAGTTARSDTHDRRRHRRAEPARRFDARVGHVARRDARAAAQRDRVRDGRARRRLALRVRPHRWVATARPPGVPPPRRGRVLGGVARHRALLGRSRGGWAAGCDSVRRRSRAPRGRAVVVPGRRRVLAHAVARLR